MQNLPFRLPRVTPLRVLEFLAEWLLGLRALECLYHKIGGGRYNGQEFLTKALRIFEVDFKIASGSLSFIPEKGSSIIVANHPFGGIEGIALTAQLLRVRPDVKVLTNELLCKIPDLRDIFIGVSVFGTNIKEKNKVAIAQAEDWVRQGHQLLIFPSGEVSSFHVKLKKISDPKWRNTAAHIARNTSASVTPVFINGNNGWLFQLLGFINPKLRTLRLIRELMNKKGKTIEFRLGKTIKKSDMAAFPSNTSLTNFLRLSTYLLSSKENETSKLSIKPERKLTPLIYPVSGLIIKDEIKSLPDKSLLIQKNGMVVYCVSSSLIPNTLREIGRLRELTFRQAGEGSGQPLDLDKYDKYYLHLFLWNRKKMEVVGAYRIGLIDQILKKYGIQGLYSRSLFRFNTRFIHRLGTSLEMGRSFIRPEYQKNLNSLLLLWKGIGAFVTENPHYRVLFGTVSISSDYSEISRLLMAGCLGMNNSNKDLADMVSPTIPIKNKGQFWSQNDLKGLKNIAQLSSMIQRIEKDNKGVPVPLRQYLKLRGQLAGFNVDPDFNNSLDGLIIVDLLNVDEPTLIKYLGSNGVQLFYSYHQQVA